MADNISSQAAIGKGENSESSVRMGERLGKRLGIESRDFDEQVFDGDDNDSRNMLEVMIVRPKRVAEFQGESEKISIGGIAFADQLQCARFVILKERVLIGRDGKALECKPNVFFGGSGFGGDHWNIPFYFPRLALGGEEPKMPGENNVERSAAQQRRDHLVGIHDEV